MTSIRKLLLTHPIEASAPCRIDSGGTWDIKSLALPCQNIEPATLNIALNLRTTVTLLPYEDGWIKVSSKGFPIGKACRVKDISFLNPFGIYFAALSYFGYHGIEVAIRSQSPVKSALGGSSTALVALIKALSKVHDVLKRKSTSKKSILHLAYHLEDAINRGDCGMQDHAAAVFGGVHLWKWRYGRPGCPYERKKLLDRKGEEALSRHLLVVYSGKSHISLRTNRNWIRDFLSNQTREDWVRLNRMTRRIAEAVKKHRWQLAADLLREEMAMREIVTQDALIPVTRLLRERAEALHCGARFAGAGAGGSMWALGSIKNIQRLKKEWESILEKVPDGRILACSVDSTGVK